MAIVKSASGSTTTISTTLTLPSSYSTKAGDVVIIAIGTANANWSGVTVSGLGATWITQSQNASGQLQGNWFAIGYNCTSGNTQVTLSSTPSTTGGVGIVVLSNCSTTRSPAFLFGPLSNATNNSTVSGTGLSWTAGQALIAFGETYGWNNITTPTGTWGGVADTFGAVSSNARQAFIDYYIAPSSLSNQTYISPQSNASYGIGAVYGYAITPAPSNGNMFLVMGL